VTNLLILSLLTKLTVRLSFAVCFLMIAWAGRVLSGGSSTTTLLASLRPAGPQQEQYRTRKEKHLAGNGRGRINDRFRRRQLVSRALQIRSGDISAIITANDHNHTSFADGDGDTVRGAEAKDLQDLKFEVQHLQSFSPLNVPLSLWKDMGRLRSMLKPGMRIFMARSSPTLEEIKAQSKERYCLVQCCTEVYTVVVLGNGALICKHTRTTRIRAQARRRCRSRHHESRKKTPHLGDTLASSGPSNDIVDMCGLRYREAKERYRRCFSSFISP
jgi:hypothetical protein